MRWAHLLFGIVSLLGAAFLLSALFRLSLSIDEMSALVGKHGSSEELGRATTSVAIVLALRATLGMLSGIFGVYEIITAIRYWTGRPSHLALSAVIEKEFGIFGDTETLP